MKTTLQQIRMVGNTFVAQPGIERFNIKKNYRNGGGILGGCLKSGDKIKITAASSDVDTISFATDLTLHRLNQSFFYNNDFFKREESEK
jgi:hypothetical protein